MIRSLGAALLVAATACSSGYRAAGPTPSPTPSPTSPPTASGSPSPPSCLDTAQTQVQINECAARDLRAADRLLATVVRAVRGDLDPARRATLDRTQRAWRTYRDTFCPTYAAGGSIDPLNVLGCRARLATDRARDVCDWAAPNNPDEAPAACAKVGP